MAFWHAKLQMWSFCNLWQKIDGAYGSLNQLVCTSLKRQKHANLFLETKNIASSRRHKCLVEVETEFLAA